MSNIAIISGLFFSSIAGSALEPSSAADYEAHQAGLVNALNVVAVLTSTIMLFTSMYATFMLYILTTSAHTPASVYRFIVSHRFNISLLQIMTYFPALGTLGMFAISIRLHSSDIAFYVSLVGMLLLLFVFQAMFVEAMRTALPWSYSKWMHVAGPHHVLLTLIRPNWRARIADHGEQLLSEAKDGVLNGIPLGTNLEDPPAPVDSHREAPRHKLRGPSRTTPLNPRGLSRTALPPLSRPLSRLL